MPEPATCFGCGAAVEDAPGVYYCAACVEAQLREQAREVEAFDAYHRFADRVARDGR
jgi:hypothetical protein